MVECDCKTLLVWKTKCQYTLFTPRLLQIHQIHVWPQPSSYTHLNVVFGFLLSVYPPCLFMKLECSTSYSTCVSQFCFNMAGQRWRSDFITQRDTIAEKHNVPPPPLPGPSSRLSVVCGPLVHLRTRLLSWAQINDKVVVVSAGMGKRQTHRQSLLSTWWSLTHMSFVCRGLVYI